jgi:predicted metalloprotease
MGKRRELLIRLVLIVVVIGCLTHTSWGLENDPVNVSHPSSLPAKSEFSQEDILNHAQKSLDMSISILNTVATLMGVLVALITIILIICVALGIFDFSPILVAGEKLSSKQREVPMQQRNMQTKLRKPQKKRNLSLKD